MILDKNIINRVLAIVNHIIDTEDTIRKTATIFNISKSTVHKDLHERLMLIDKDKYEVIQKIMTNHIKIRHINGGESTRQLFLRKKQLTL